MALTGVFDLNEVASKLSVTGVNSLSKAIRHVPKNITRVLSDGPTTKSNPQDFYNRKYKV